MPDAPKWITTQDAANRLRVSTARIRQMMAEGQLTGQKMGGKYRGQWQIKSSDVELKAYKKGVTNTMRVKNRMTPSPITASLETNYNQASKTVSKIYPSLTKKAGWWASLPTPTC